MTEPKRTLPTVVIGAGPVGMTAAAHLLDRGLDPLVLEAGPTAGASLRSWGHVRLFSPWEYLVDPVAVRLLEVEGWATPDPAALPTGDELADGYVKPLAELPALRHRIRYDTRVVGVTKQGIDKLTDRGRENAPFEVIVEHGGRTERFLAHAVVDASGTWRSPNPLGSGGLLADGEAAAGDRITYGIPAVLGAARERYAGRRVAVVGSGHSALNAILELAELRAADPATTIAWVIRGVAAAPALGGGDADELPARGALGTRVAGLLRSGDLVLEAGFQTRAVELDGEHVALVDGDRRIEVDEVIACTGFRPDLGILAELRLALDDRVEAPRALAPMIDPNHHSCGTVAAHGADELRHPDDGVYIVGMKSYGRAPTFLLRTGYEQVRSVAAALAGDWEAARRVELTLPETGVCCVSDDGSSSCGGPAIAPPQGLIELTVVEDSCCAAPAPDEPATVA
jgi:hypothetical protein